MKKIILLFLLIILAIHSNSQNLVPNPGFEYHTPSYTCNCCSNSGNYSDCFNDWNSPIGTTPDFFGTCCPWNFLGIPFNDFGFQLPHSGVHYSGINIYVQCGWPYSIREYIQCQLFQTLDSNKFYVIKLYVSLGDTMDRASSNISIYFSDTLIHYPSSSMIKILNFTPQFQNPDSNIITDKIEWVEISGTYIATGEERFIVIGNFLDDSSSNIISVPGGYSTVCHNAYYYIDDIMIRQIDTVHYPAVAGNDTLICFGDSIRLGLYDFSDYSYQWNPAAGVILSGISNDTMGIPWVKPTINTTYYLYQIDNYGVQSTDSITVYVDCFPANAGYDTVFICNGDSIQIGTHNFVWYDYKWSSSYGLEDSTAGITYAKPLTNMRYFLTVTDTLGHITTDSIDIFVVSCFPANAGSDTSICKGDTLQIGSHNYTYYDYSWQSAVGSQQVYGNISDSMDGTPLVWPDTTTAFYLHVIDSIGNITYDTVLISVVNCDTLGLAETELDFCKVYPNPAKEIVYVSFSIMNYELGIMCYELMDMFGKVLRREVLDNHGRKFSIDVSTLPEGVYVLRIMGKENTIRKKLVILK
ncbi:T9SS type A sorting domain-containing protein [Bacteroidota bacterium]